MLLIRKIPTFTALVRGELIIFNFVEVRHMGEILLGEVPAYLLHYLDLAVDWNV